MDISNLAIGTIITIFLFFIPGIIFNRFYYTGYFSKQYVKRVNSAYSIVPTIVPSFIFQIIFCWFIERHTNNELDLDLLASVIFPIEREAVPDILKNLDKQYFDVLLYNFALWAFAAFAGILCQYFIRYFRIDRKIKLFRFENQWHYILRGEILDFPNISGDYERVEFTLIEVLTEMQGQTLLYKGLLEDYNLTNEGSGLENVIISHFERRIIYPPVTSNPSKAFRGDLLIIPYKNIVNINVIYYRKDKSNKIDEYKTLISKIFQYFLLIPVLVIATPLFYLKKGMKALLNKLFGTTNT